MIYIMIYIIIYIIILFVLLFICLHIPFCISFNPTLPKPFRDRKQEGASVDWALVWEDPHKSRSVQGTQGEGHLGLRADLKQVMSPR